MRSIKEHIFSFGFWVGANDIDQAFNFVWMDGSEMIYKDFAEGEPNNFGGNEHCVQVIVQFRNFIFRFIYQELLFYTCNYIFFLICQSPNVKRALDQPNFTCSLLFR